MLGGAVMLLALAAASALPAPAPSSSNSSSQTDPQNPVVAEDVLYDQRQNGTENFRVQMSDVTLIVAPAEALLAVNPSDLFQSQLKPKLADSSKPSR